MAKNKPIDMTPVIPMLELNTLSVRLNNKINNMPKINENNGPAIKIKANCFFRFFEICRGDVAAIPPKNYSSLLK